MKLNTKLTLVLPVVSVLMFTGGTVLAADAPMICAVTQAISCAKENDCISGSANSINMPLFLRINPEKNEIVSMKESRERRISVIKQASTDVENRFLIYQGVEQGGAWSVVVDKTTGSMTATIAAGEQDAFIVYGACSAALLNP